ncbi:MAG: sigma-54-dependent Fis family transcriptional regulator [Calditrichaeota bacterium]|nr:sigma-54-dependent Fis family transcriptional regulator [Calditrichota bacterium]
MQVKKNAANRVRNNPSREETGHFRHLWIEAFPGVLPVSRGMRALLEKALLPNPEQNALILGPTGTGKEHFAIYLHRISPRKAGPFIPINLGGQSPTFAESDLFGHLPGAFTGARGRRQGVFERAAGGTVFLDEIDKADLSLQQKLLRVLECRTFLPLGGEKEQPLNCRIIMAGNRDLHKMVEEGDFLEDFYFRIATYVYRLPALKERPEDILHFAQAFLCEANDLHGRHFEGFDQALIAYMVAHPWPGNLRQLRNLVYRLVGFHEGRILRYAFLEKEPGMETPTPASLNLDDQLREILERALRLAGGNIRLAAQMLEINYSTLRSKLKKLGLDNGRGGV